jgi:glycosyltransferase involved in cell wall biosynthesis
MRVLHVVESLDRGGLERVVCDLAIEQQRRGHFVEVMCLFTAGEFAADLLAAGLTVQIADKKPGLDLAAMGRLRAAARAGGHQVLHTHNPVANYYACMAMPLSWRSLPIVNTRHNMGARNPADRREQLFRWSMLRTAKVAMVSPQVSRKFVDARVVPQAKAAVVMNGIPIDRYLQADEGSRAAARQTLGLPAEGRIVGSVGRLVGVKNHALLLAAAAPLCQADPGLRLVLIGDGELREALRQQARELGISDQLVLTGERADIPKVLPAFDVFAMPSISEGHSIALLEAACTGLPAVATAVGGNPEIIQDGRTGVLVPTQDVEALRAALAALLSDTAHRQALGAQARQWARDTVSLAAMTSRYEDLYRSVVHTERG